MLMQSRWLVTYVMEPCVILKILDVNSGPSCVCIGKCQVDKFD